eukprot:CAMPEP_0205947514 /NCGR_PEP_ID=MMETSP1459-20131121/11_1 /ASSEMBLY_ACC=CAM_ASM_001120 /TAXON_ID=41880 /ORGANISM="Pycnococcus provasolii, Strain RCC931" /LENGTH=114 /DNA_ID=CAMNT_0053318617 /DNA_START=256 /DNA_END=600 /DNA_ORIENTATION=-
MVVITTKHSHQTPLLSPPLSKPYIFCTARAVRSARCVRVTASAKPQMPQRVEKVAAGVTAAAGAMLASPLYAEAASLSPSLKNLIGSVIAGATVFGGIFGAVYFVSNFDPVSRK